HLRTKQRDPIVRDGDRLPTDRRARDPQLVRRRPRAPARCSTPDVEERRDGRVEGTLGRIRQSAGQKKRPGQLRRRDPVRLAGPFVQPSHGAVGAMAAHHALAGGCRLEGDGETSSRDLEVARWQGDGEECPHPRTDVRGERGAGHGSIAVAFNTAMAFLMARPVAWTERVAPAMFRTSRYGRSGSGSVLRAYCLRNRRSRTSPPYASR